MSNEETVGGAFGATTPGAGSAAPQGDGWTYHGAPIPYDSSNMTDQQRAEAYDRQRYQADVDAGRTPAPRTTGWRSRLDGTTLYVETRGQPIGCVVVNGKTVSA